jgi:uncharacterized protein YhaN
MKVRRLDLIAFGPFENHTLELSSGDAGLDVIYGDNEDGKSTTMRAIRGLLYGIDERTPDAYRFSGAQLRIGGTLRTKAGVELSVIRRKGRKSTLWVAGTEEPLPDNALAPFIGFIDEKEFSQRYGIDHLALVEGGKGILDQTGEIGTALFSAATGTASIKETLDQLESEADKHFKSRPSSTKIGGLASEYSARAKEAKEKSLPSAEWTKLLEERDEVKGKRDQQDQAKRGLEREKTSLERVKRTRPLLAQLERLVHDLVELGLVVDLPENFEKLRSGAISDKRNAETQLGKIVAKKKLLVEAAAELQVPTAVIERAQAIALLGQKLGSYDQDQNDRPVQDGKRRQCMTAALETLRAIQPDLAIEKVDTLRPLLALERTLQQLSSQREKLVAGTQHCQREVRLRNEKLERLQGEKANVAETRDPRRLSAALRDVQRAGDLDEQIQQATDKCERVKAECTVELERLGLWKGSEEEEFARLPLPVTETVDHYKREFDGVAKSLQRNAERQNEAAEDQKQVTALIATLERGGHLPTLEDLKKVRSRRDEGWSLVRRQYIGKEMVDDEVRTYADDRVLPEVYEETVKQSDDVADRLRVDAERVQKRESYDGDLAKYTGKQTDLEEEAGELLAARESLQGEWRRIWAAVGIEPRTPEEMAAWLAKAEKLREKLDEVRGAQCDRAALIEKRNTSIKALNAELEALGESLDVMAKDHLGPILDRAQQLIEEIKANVAREKELVSTVQGAVEELKRAEEDLKGAQDRLDEWQLEWVAATRRFGFLEDHSVHMVQTALEQLKALFAYFDKAEDLKRRVSGIEDRIKAFETEVDAFAEAIRLPRSSQPIYQYVAGLRDSLTEAQRIATQLEGTREKQLELDRDEIEVKGALGGAEAQLEELRKQAKVDNDDELLAAGEHSQKARDLRTKIATQETSILQAGDSRSMAELRSEAVGVDVDTLEAEIAQKEDAISRIEQERSITLQREGALTSQITAKDGTGAAAEASEQAASALAQMRDEVRTYLKLRAAALILKDQIEGYRQQNQTPVLRRAGALFSTLTLGSFKGLRDDVDDHSQPVLRGVRPDNQEVGVEGMSEGARDQLYLALRLATLEQGLGNGEPMPLIVDDILIGFDDARTEACLKVLADFAKRTQVLVFTHHQRVAEIARTLAKTGEIAVRELRP